MKLTLSTANGDVYVLEVSADIELENLKALAECEVGIPASEIVLLHNMRPLAADKRPISEQGVREGDILLVDRGRPNGPSNAAAQPGAGAASSDLMSLDAGSSPAAMREKLLANPTMLAALRSINPTLADAVHVGLEEFTQILEEMQRKHVEREQARLRMLSADPFDPEAQQLIAEHIRQQNVNSNMEAAMEYHPESFGLVTMLYINCRVNGHPVKAFVDSGAQSTIISSACAERCGIMRLVDSRWAGIAKGVGTQKIIGRIHLVQIEIEKDFLNSNFSVLEDQSMDMLLGLDMLKRHQCVIDLKRNCLVIGTTGTETAFLPESELPACARMAEAMDEDIPEKIRKQANRLATTGGKSAASASAAGVLQGSSGSGGNSGTSKSSSSKNPNNEAKEPANAPNEKMIGEIVALGFKREDAVRELVNAKGDKNQAIGALFAKSFVVPKQ